MESPRTWRPSAMTWTAWSRRWSQMPSREATSAMGHGGPTAPIVSFLSDYGLLDEFVGVCHGVIASRCPRARVIDLTHSIAPQDVRAMLFSRYRDADARRRLAAEKPPASLVQIAALAPRPTLKGADIAAADQLAAGLEQAFDYRGDVTITLQTGESVEGYIFDRDLAAATMRILTKAGRKIAIAYADVARLSFAGRDMADGRSWEAWVGKYAQRKAAGEKNIELVPETIE